MGFNPRARMGRDSNLFNLQITNPLEDGFRENNAKHHPLPFIVNTQSLFN